MDVLKWNNPGIVADLVPKKSEGVTIPNTHEELLFMAQLAEQTERQDEMVLCMKKIVKLNSELDQNERNLLSVAYKNVLNARRSAWRIATSVEQQNDSAEAGAVIVALREEFEKEVAAVCEDLLSLLDSYLIPAAPRGESKVFYLKMKGDYHRYYAEVMSGETQKKSALDAYIQAQEMATAALPSTNPVRLGLILNLSVFYYEIMKEHQKGYELAAAAYSDAVGDLEGQANTDDPGYQETVLMVELLRDNLKLWEGTHE